MARLDLIAEDGHALLIYHVRPGEACALTAACLVAAEACSAEARAKPAVGGALLPARAFHAPMGASAAFRSIVLAGFGARRAALPGRGPPWSHRRSDGIARTHFSPWIHQRLEHELRSGERGVLDALVGINPCPASGRKA